MGNVPSTSTESIPDDVLLRSLESQALLVGSALTPANNRFLKTLRCRRAGEAELTLVKIFLVKNVDLAPYKEKLKAQKALLTIDTAPNVLAYQRFREGGGTSPAFVSRQYLLSNLKDRLSTRPFLVDMEKLWIAYCLISAGKQLHSVGLAHGDIKSENVLLTSWGWPVLTDLAPFKPTFLQADQSAAPFNFFFSIGRKRCYLAPERFITTSATSSKSSTSSKEALKRRFAEVMASKDADLKKAANVLADTAGVPRSDHDEKNALMAELSLNPPVKGAVSADADLTGWRKDLNDELLPSMDVFSIGCVLTELFNSDAEAAFELSDALQYASKGESPRLSRLLGKISNPGVRALAESMTKFEPAHRLSLDSYLNCFEHVFPECFSTFLYDFMKSLVNEQQQSSIEETIVWRTCERYGDICEHLLGFQDESGKHLFEGFKLKKAERDAFLASRKSRSPPQSTPVVVDSEDASLDAMETIIRDLEHKLSAVAKSSSFMSPRTPKDRLKSEEEEVDNDIHDADSPQSCSPVIIIISYLCMSIQFSSKASTRVLAILLATRLSRLERHSEMMLTRVLPFLVDRLVDTSAWVRCASLRSITDLLECVSQIPSSEVKMFSDYLIPSFSECARDASEAVRVTFANCLPSLATSAKRFLELNREHQRGEVQQPQTDQPVMAPYDAEIGGLHDAIQKLIDRTVATDHTGGGADMAVKQGLVCQVVPLCLFFGRDRLDRWLLPWLLSFLNTRGPGNWHLQVAVLRSLAPIGAFIGDEAFFQYLYPLIEDMLNGTSHELVIEAASHCLTSLVKLSLLRNIDMFKLVKKLGPLVRHPSLRVRRSAILLLAAISSSSKILPYVDVQLFVAEKLKPFYSPRNNNEAEKFIVLLGKPEQTLERNSLLLEQCLNTEPYPSMDEWLKDFAKGRNGNSSASSNGRNGRTQDTNNKLKALVRIHFLKTNESSGTSTSHEATLRAVRNRYGIVLEEEINPKSLLRRALALDLPETRLSLGRMRSDWSRPASPAQPPQSETPPLDRSSTRLQRNDSAPTSALVVAKPTSIPNDWKPKGLMVSSFHEHAGPVNRIAVADDFSFLVTGSDDGTAKVWRTDKLDRNPCPRSRVTFETQGGRVVDLCAIRASHSVAVMSDTGRVSVVRVDAQADSSKNLKVDSTSRLVAIACSSVNELIACTERGSVFQWDMRSAGRKQDMSLVYGFGSVSCMTVSPDGSWLALGTHRGVIALFDLRFNMLIAAWRHPCSCAIHRLYCPKSTYGMPFVYVAAGPNQAVWLDLSNGNTRHAFACAPSEVSSDKAKLGEWKLSQETLFSKKYEAVDLSTRQLDRYIQEAKFASSSVHSSAFSSPHHSIRAFFSPADLSLSTITGMEPPSLLTAGTDMIVRYWDCSPNGATSGFITAPADEPKCKWEAKDFTGRQGTMFLSLSGPKSSSTTTTKAKGKFVVRPAHHDAILDMVGLKMPSDGSPHLVTAGRDNMVRIWK